MDRERYLQGRAQRWLETAFYLGLVAAVLAMSAWLVLGPSALWWLGALAAVFLLTAANVPLSLVLRSRGARRLSRWQAPELHDIVDELAQRSRLEAVPELHHVASLEPQAFAVSSRDRSAVVVTEGLLRLMTPRELVGVLAHELSHLRNGDTRLLVVARWMGQLTRTMTTVGLVFAFVSAVLMPEPLASPLTLLVLFGAPTLSTFALLALSRTREFAADLSAAAITGDPEGLASGLLKLKAHQSRLLARLLPFPVRELQIPEWVSTHPDTRARVERLLELTPRPPRPPGRALPLSPSYHRP